MERVAKPSGMRGDEVLAIERKIGRVNSWNPEELIGEVDRAEFGRVGLYSCTDYFMHPLFTPLCVACLVVRTSFRGVLCKQLAP